QPVRVTVTGRAARAARARVTDRRGALVGTAGLLPAGSAPGAGCGGEVWVPLPAPSDFQIDLEVGKQRVARRKVRLAPPRRWTLYWLATNHTDVGYTDLQERCLEVHRKNLDAALARLAAHPDFRWSAECALQVLSYVENRSPAAGDAPASRGRSHAHRAHRGMDGLPAALLVGGTRRGAGAALARVPLRRRAALRVRRRPRRHGAASFRLAAHEPGVRLAGISL